MDGHRSYEMNDRPRSDRQVLTAPAKDRQIEADGDIGCCGYILMFVSILLLICTFPFSLMCSLKTKTAWNRTETSDVVDIFSCSGYKGERIDADGEIGGCGYVLMALSILILIFTFPFSLMCALKVVQEYERAVIFRLGRVVSGGAKGPGLFFLFPCVDTFRSVDLRTFSYDIPPQEILTKDSVTVAVDAVIYARIFDATMSIINVEDAHASTKLLAATTLRTVLGMKALSEILSDRENISHTMQSNLDEATDPWGVKVERVEIKDVRLPVQMQRAMAAEAESAREARAKVIAAEGEMKASRALKEAADVMMESPSALQLRYLQTLNSIAAERNSTIIFPLPIDMLKSLTSK